MLFHDKYFKLPYLFFYSEIMRINFKTIQFPWQQLFYLISICRRITYQLPVASSAPINRRPNRSFILCLPPSAPTSKSCRETHTSMSIWYSRPVLKEHVFRTTGNKGHNATPAGINCSVCGIETNIQTYGRRNTLLYKLLVGLSPPERILRISDEIGQW